MNIFCSKKSDEKIRVPLKYDKNNGTSYADQYKGKGKGRLWVLQQ